MKRNLMVAGCALACGMLFGAKPASAATTNIVATGPGIGSWNVTLTQTTATGWHVDVVANSADTPVVNAESLTVTFFDGTNQATAATIPVATATGGTVPTGNGQPLPPAGTGPWVPGVGANAAFDTHTPPNAAVFALAANGSTRFTGDITLASATTVKSFRAALLDNSFAWQGSSAANVVPEPATLALALPGIMPFGLMLLKRRRRSEDSVAEELAA